MSKLTVLSFCFVLLCCLSFSTAAIAASDEEEVLQVATNFVKALNSGDFELMSSLHVHSPILSKFTPNKAGSFLTQGWEAVEKGWKGMFEAQVGTFNLTVHHPQATILGNNAAVLTVYYIVTQNPPETSDQTINQLRQTLVVQKSSGKWLIVHEHTSMLPVE